MSPSTKTIIKAVLAGGLCLTAVAVAVDRLRRALATGEEGLQVWFYDQSERELYAVPRDTIPPHEGCGGRKGDGVRALVVVCPADRNDPSKRRIAYLETYMPQLKKMLEDIREARAHGRVYGKPIPDRDSDYCQKNTLVRRLDETAWHDMTTDEGQSIVAQWQSGHCPNGLSPVICTP